MNISQQEMRDIAKQLKEKHRLTFLDFTEIDMGDDITLGVPQSYILGSYTADELRRAADAMDEMANILKEKEAT